MPHMFTFLHARIKYVLNYAQIPGEDFNPTPFSQLTTAQWGVSTPWLRAHMLNNFIYLLHKKE